MKNWRAKYYRIRISRSRQLVITARRFRLSNEHQSKLEKQYVQNIYLSQVRQLVFTIQRLPQKPKTTRQKRSWSASQVFKHSAVVPVIIILGLAGSLFFGIKLGGKEIDPPKTFSSNIASANQQQQQPAKPKDYVKPLPASIPTHLAVPSVGINYDTITVGREADGTIQMPPLLSWLTGWYKYSPTPGELGPSIIVGHVDNYKNVSVFWNLRYVKPGDDIFVSRADGKTAHFKVTDLKQFQQADFPTKEVYGNINFPGLRLITCGGAFDTSTASYSENTVVYAKLVNS